MRISSLAAGVLAAVAIAGCGGGADPSAAVRRTVHEFVNAFLSGDYPGACSLFSRGSLARLGGRSRCAEQLRVAAAKPEARQQARQLATEIDGAPILVSGNVATANVGGRRPSSFVRQHGVWAIDGAP